MPRYTDLALGAGAVLAVGLGLLALQPDELPSSKERDSAVGSSVPMPAQSSKGTDKAKVDDKGTEDAVPTGKLPDAWVVGAGDGFVVRAPQRGCDAEGPVTLTAIGKRGGTTQREVEGLRAVGGIDVTDAHSAVIVGVDGDCERVGFGTTDGGESWQALDTVPAIWSLVPDDDDQVHAPSGQVDIPCEPLAITGLDDRVARLACVDGRLLGTVSGGDDWSILGNNDDVRAVGFVSPTTALALVERDDCNGISVDVSTDGGTDFEAAYCVEGKGPWGLFADRDAAVVAGLDTVASSDDDGENWTAKKLGS